MLSPVRIDNPRLELRDCDRTPHPAETWMLARIRENSS